MHLGAEALAESIDLIAQGKTTGLPQNPDLVSHAPKVYHETGELDWSASAKTCHNLIRGLNPFPGAWTLYDGKEVKILRTLIVTDPEVLAKAAQVKPGTLLPLDKNETASGAARGLAITTGNGGLLEIVEVKPAGKKAMSGADWRNGMRLEEATAL